MSLNKILFSIALVLALLAALVKDPVSLSKEKINDLAVMIETEKDHILADSLAWWIKEGTKKIRLIDLRDSLSYVEYHIPGAEFMSLHDLVGGGVKRNELIVIYSKGGIHAAQAWALLKIKNYQNVFTILGGFDAWQTEILYPTLESNTNENEKKIFEKRKELSAYFGGAPQILNETNKKEREKKKLPHQQIQFQKIQKEKERLREGC